MATRAQLIKALEAADAAGDTEAATELAKALKAGAGTPAPAPAPAPEPVAALPADEPSRGAQVADFAGRVGENMLAGGDVALSIASGGPAQIAGGLAGLAGTVLFDAETGMEWLNKATNALQWDPKTDKGRRAIQTVSEVVGAAEQVVDDGIWRWTGGDPNRSAMAKSIVFGGPAVLTGGRTLAKVRESGKRWDQMAKRAEDLGIPVDRRKIGPAVVERAKERSSARGAGMQEVQRQLIKEKEKRRAEVEAGYEEALRTPAYTMVDDVKQFQRGFADGLIKEGFDLEEMPILQKRLDDLEILDYRIPGQMTDMKSPTNLASLQSLDMIRKRINRNRSTNPAENVALNRLKHNLDDFIENQFDKDAIIAANAADRAQLPELQARWKNATKTAQEYKADFSDNRTIDRLVNQKDVTLEQMRSWIFGANAINPNGQSVAVVNRIAKLTGGKDSKVMQGLRQDALWDVMEPLLRDNGPDFMGFIRKAETFEKKNRRLLTALGVDKRQLHDLRRAAKAAEHAAQSGLGEFGWRRALAQALFGHDIARRALRVRFMTRIMEHVTGAKRVSKRQLLRDITGEDHRTSVNDWAPELGVQAQMSDMFGTDEWEYEFIPEGQ